MKRIALTLFIFSISFASWAQDESKGGGGIGIGIKGGLNFAGVTDPQGFEFDNRTGILVGAYVPIMFNKGFGIQPEIIFSSQGAKFESDVSKYNYVNIPLLLQWRFLKIIKLQVGPQIGFLTSAEVDGNDVAEFLKDTDLSLAFGAEVLLPLGLMAGARYNLGLTDINDGFPTIDDNIQNRVLQLYVGFKLIGKR
jgi:hypothetical protein